MDREKLIEQMSRDAGIPREDLELLGTTREKLLEGLTDNTRPTRTSDVMRRSGPFVVAPESATTEQVQRFSDSLTASGRKEYPIATGAIDYFPDAIAEVAHISFLGNRQHHPGTPVHWDRSKSTDEADALMRHFVRRGQRDQDGARHTAKMAWRALALLQKELESETQNKL